MQTQKNITLFGTVSNSATSRKNGHKYTAFGVAIITSRSRFRPALASS